MYYVNHSHILGVQEMIVENLLCDIPIPLVLNPLYWSKSLREKSAIIRYGIVW